MLRHEQPEIPPHEAAAVLTARTGELAKELEGFEEAAHNLDAINDATHDPKETDAAVAGFAELSEGATSENVAVLELATGKAPQAAQVFNDQVDQHNQQAITALDGLGKLDPGLQRHALNQLDESPSERQPAVETQSEKDRKHAYEAFFEALRLPEKARTEAIAALREGVRNCREEFASFDDETLGAAVAQLSRLMEGCLTVGAVATDASLSDYGMNPAVYQLHDKFLGVNGSVYKALDIPYDEGAIDQAATKAVKHHPLTAAFMAAIEESESPASRKRTPYELQIAMAQAEQDFRRRQGLGNNEDLRLHPNARRPLERQKWHIEEEELPDTKSGQDDVQSRALNFFINLLPEAKRSEFRRSFGELVASWPKTGDKVTQSNLKKRFKLITEIEDALDSFESEDIPIVGQIDRLVKKRMSERFVFVLHNEISGTPDAALRLHKTREVHQSLLLRKYFAYANHEWHDLPETQAERLRQMDKFAWSHEINLSEDWRDARDYGANADFSQEWMLSPGGQLSGHDFNINDTSHSANYDVAAFEELPPLADVWYAENFPATVPRAARLIQPAKKPVMDDVSRVQNHLVITPRGGLSAEQDVYAPVGFTLEWARNGKLHLAYNAENDPYSPAKIALPEGAIDKITAQYQEAGLGELAHMISETPIQTVDQFVRVLSRAAGYAMHGSGKSVTTETLTDLAHAYQTDDGRLSYQCTGAAQLLKLSLGEIYGADSVSVVRGKVLKPGSNKIDVAGHAQVRFTSPDGHVYYLDATPAMPGELPRADASTEDENEDQPSHAPSSRDSEAWLAYADAKLAEADNAVPEIKKLTRAEADELVATVRTEELLPTLGTWFAIQPVGEKGKDALYRKILGLGQDDPIRSVLELTHQIPAGTAEVERATRLKALLDVIRQHPSDSLLFQRIPRHTDSRLEVLIDIVGKIETAYRRVG